MFSSLNFLFLTSIGITTWILLCLTNQQNTSNYSEWRQAFEEYQEKRSSPKSGISIEPPILLNNKSNKLLKNREIEAPPKLTENLSDFGYSRNSKSPFLHSYLSRDQITRLSLLCPFIVVAFVIYNAM